MIRGMVIACLLALAAVAQTATNRAAVDIANRTESERDFVPAGDWTTNNLRLWLPFLVSPTNSTTFNVGDCSPWRQEVVQTNVPSQPVWTSGVMRFTGSNYLDLGAGVLQRRNQTFTFWTRQPTSGIYVATDITPTNGVIGLTTGTNSITLLGGGSSNVSATINWPTGWLHVAVSVEFLSSGPAWRASLFTNGSVCASGRFETASASAGNKARLHGRWTAANEGTIGAATLWLDDFRLYLTNLTPAAIGAVYSNGLGRARP